MIKSWTIRWAGTVARIGAKRNVYRILAGKKSVVRLNCWWVDNIKIQLILER
jgi:hypothetical protein